MLLKCKEKTRPFQDSGHKGLGTRRGEAGSREANAPRFDSFAERILQLQQDNFQIEHYIKQLRDLLHVVPLRF